MTEVTRLLSAVEQGDAQAAEKLLPLIYDELRKLAAHKMAQEKPGQTLQATALVHEVYIRLVDVEEAEHWASRGHFFAAAAEAMRRILVDNARRKASSKRGGDRQRVDLPDLAEYSDGHQVDLLALDEAFKRLEKQHPEQAQVVKLRFFINTYETAFLQCLRHRLWEVCDQKSWEGGQVWKLGQRAAPKPRPA